MAGLRRTMAPERQHLRERSDTMKDYLNLPLSELLDDAQSRQPTPGGGAIAAMVGALAATMAAMSANFTLGPAKYKSVEPQVRQLLDDLLSQRERFADLMQQDMQAYTTVLAAYKLPKESDDQQAARREAIQQAVRRAMDVPLQTARAALETLQSACRLAPIANANLLSDVAVAAILAAAVFDCAKLNVEVNIPLCDDDRLVAETRRALAEMRQLCDDLKSRCLTEISSRQT